MNPKSCNGHRVDVYLWANSIFVFEVRYLNSLSDMSWRLPEKYGPDPVGFFARAWDRYPIVRIPGNDRATGNFWAAQNRRADARPLRATRDFSAIRYHWDTRYFRATRNWLARSNKRRLKWYKTFQSLRQSQYYLWVTGNVWIDQE